MCCKVFLFELEKSVLWITTGNRKEVSAVGCLSNKVQKKVRVLCLYLELLRTFNRRPFHFQSISFSLLFVLFKKCVLSHMSLNVDGTGESDWRGFGLGFLLFAFAGLSFRSESNRYALFYRSTISIFSCIC